MATKHTTRMKKARRKSWRIAGEPIKFCDHEPGTVQAAYGKRLRKLRSIGLLAALDLGELGDDLPITAVEIVRNRLLLRFQAKPRTALPGGADAIMGHMLAGVCHAMPHVYKHLNQR